MPLGEARTTTGGRPGAAGLLLIAAVCAACPGGDLPPEGPRFVSGPLAVDVRETQATISWATDVAASGAVTLRPVGGGEPISASTAAPSQAHDLVVSGLSPRTEYTAELSAEAGGFVTRADAFTLTTPGDVQPGFFRVLFDASHDEDAGNADWVIDDADAVPSPAVPGSELDWEGAISSWGFDLFTSGRYEIRSVARNGRISLDDPSNPEDLSNFDAFILPEPNSRFNAAEIADIREFVSRGGGLILVADHVGSDRNGDGFDSTEILNELMGASAASFGLFGVRFVEDFGAPGGDVQADPNNNVDSRQGVPAVDGPFGFVQVIGINDGTTMERDPAGPSQAIAWDAGAPRGDTLIVAAVSSFGAGKIFLIGDSSPADDGTARPGNDNIFDSWNAPGQQNDILFLNAVAFVVGDGE
jgi:hypothetical protein